MKWLFVAAALVLGYAIGHQTGMYEAPIGRDHVQIYPVGAACNDATYDNGDGTTSTFVCSKSYQGPMLSIRGTMVRFTDSCPAPQDGNYGICKDGVIVSASE